jgi:hypothetical protein
MEIGDDANCPSPEEVEDRFYHSRPRALPIPKSEVCRCPPEVMRNSSFKKPLGQCCGRCAEGAKFSLMWEGMLERG